MYFVYILVLNFIRLNMELMIYSNRVHPDSKQVFDKEYAVQLSKKFVEFRPQQCFYIDYKIKIVDRRQTLLNL